MVYLTLIHLSSLGRVNPMHVRDPPPLSTYTTHTIKNLKLLHAAFGAARWHRGKPLVCHIGWRQIMWHLFTGLAVGVLTPDTLLSSPPFPQCEITRGRKYFSCQLKPPVHCLRNSYHHCSVVSIQHLSLVTAAWLPYASLRGGENKRGNSTVSWHTCPLVC